MPFPNNYDREYYRRVLGLEPEATMKEINKEYEAQSEEYKEDQKKLGLLREAHHVLSELNSLENKTAPVLKPMLAPETLRPLKEARELVENLANQQLNAVLGLTPTPLAPVPKPEFGFKKPLKKEGVSGFSVSPENQLEAEKTFEAPNPFSMELKPFDDYSYSFN